MIWKTFHETERRVALGAHLIDVDGRIQREGEVVRVVAYKLYDLNAVLGGLRDRGLDAGDLALGASGPQFPLTCRSV